MSEVNVADFTAAVNFVARRTRDPDLAQDAALFTWEHLAECRGNVRAWMLAVAFQMRRRKRDNLAHEIDAMSAYAAMPRATCELPEQEQAVMAAEVRRLARPASASKRQALKARAFAAELLAA